MPVLPAYYCHIVKLTLDNTEHVNPFDGKKDIRVDVECYDEDRTRFVVEMQLADQAHFYERAVSSTATGSARISPANP